MRGPSWGAGIGLGSMKLTCDACDGEGGGLGFAFLARGGWWVLPERLAIVGQVGFLLLGTGDDADSDDDEIEVTFGALAQVPMSPKVWLAGGAALGIYRPPVDAVEIGSGPVLIGALGYQATVAPSALLELQARVTLGIYDGYRTQSLVFLIGGAR